MGKVEPWRENTESERESSYLRLATDPTADENLVFQGFGYYDQSSILIAFESYDS